MAKQNNLSHAIDRMEYWHHAGEKAETRSTRWLARRRQTYWRGVFGYHALYQATVRAPGEDVSGFDPVEFVRMIGVRERCRRFCASTHCQNKCGRFPHLNAAAVSAPRVESVPVSWAAVRGEVLSNG